MPPKITPKANKLQKKKKSKKDEAEKLTTVDKTFYELTIKDLNNRLGRLRTVVRTLEVTNVELAEKMRFITEDRTDTTAYLDRMVDEKTDKIREIENQMLDLSKVRETEAKESGYKFKDMEVKYQTMHEQLSSEIKLLNGKLNSLEEFRILRDDLLSKFDEQDALFKEQEKNHKEFTNDLEQAAIIEKDQLKKEVETKLLQLSEDFTKSNEIRIAGYTRRLIRENIALTKEVDTIMITQQRMASENKSILKMSRDLKEKFNTNEITKKRVVKTCQKQMKIIEKITNQYDALKKKYIEIRFIKTIQPETFKNTSCTNVTCRNLSTKLKNIEPTIEKLKQEKETFELKQKQQEKQIVNLTDILRNIKYTVQTTYRATVENCYVDKEFQNAQINLLLSELMQLITKHEMDFKMSSSVSTLSSNSSIKPQRLLNITNTGHPLLAQNIKQEYSKNMPANMFTSLPPQKQDNDEVSAISNEIHDNTLFDVEIDSSIILSSSHENIMENPVDDEDKNEEEFAPSSSEESIDNTKPLSSPTEAI